MGIKPFFAGSATQGQLDSWDGRLPQASEADITTGGPTFEWSANNPATYPNGEQAVWQVTASGSSGSFDITMPEGVLTVNVGDVPGSEIQTALDVIENGAWEAVGASWEDFELRTMAEAYFAGDPLTMDDSSLVGGSATIAVVNPGRYEGLTRPRGSEILFVDGADYRKHLRQMGEPHFKDWQDLQLSGSYDDNTGNRYPAEVISGEIVAAVQQDGTPVPGNIQQTAVLVGSVPGNSFVANVWFEFTASDTGAGTDTTLTLDLSILTSRGATAPEMHSTIGPIGAWHGDINPTERGFIMWNGEAITLYHYDGTNADTALVSTDRIWGMFTLLLMCS